MILNHNDYLDYELPTNWCTEYDEDNLLIYDPNGNGAMTITFFNVLESEETLDEQISIMAKTFIEKMQLRFMLH